MCICTKRRLDIGRHRKRRCCRGLDREGFFKPVAIPLKDLEIVEVKIDEFEAVRLCDLEQKSQIEAGDAMGISRGTVQRLLESARMKIIDALLNSKALKIENLKSGGHDEDSDNITG